MKLKDKLNELAAKSAEQELRAPLLAATKNNDAEAVKSILQDNPGILKAQDDPALYHAATNNRRDIVDILLAHGARAENLIAAAQVFSQDGLASLLNEAQTKHDERKKKQEDHEKQTLMDAYANGLPATDAQITHIDEMQRNSASIGFQAAAATEGLAG